MAELAALARVPLHCPDPEPSSQEDNTGKGNLRYVHMHRFMYSYPELSNVCERMFPTIASANDKRIPQREYLMGVQTSPSNNNSQLKPSACMLPSICFVR